MSVDLLLAQVDWCFAIGRAGNDLLQLLHAMSVFVTSWMHPEMRLYPERRYGGELKSERTHQVVKNTLVQQTLGLAALPELLVVVLKALPVVAELVEAVLVEVLQPVCKTLVSAVQFARCTLLPLQDSLAVRGRLHAGGASGNLPALLHAVQLAGAVGLGLAEHVVVIVGLASRADEEGGGQKRGGAGADLLDLGDVVGQRGGVD